MRSWKELPKKHTIHTTATAKPDRSPPAPEPEHYRARLAKPVWICRSPRVEGFDAVAFVEAEGAVEAVGDEGVGVDAEGFVVVKRMRHAG